MGINYGGIDTNTHPCHVTLLGFRHGRVIVLDPRCGEVLMCDPISVDQHRIAIPPEFRMLDITQGAVICADGDEGHVHRGCHSSPFKVVLVHIMWELGGRAGARVYS
jgi:hypothetical protein